MTRKPPPFGAKQCPSCKRLGCLDHIPIEEDYPASAWDLRHDYGPRKGGKK